MIVFGQTDQIPATAIGEVTWYYSGRVLLQQNQLPSWFCPSDIYRDVFTNTQISIEPGFYGAHYTEGIHTKYPCS